MKKGFTLIEVIAVIVVLAIIAVISVPITINILKDMEEKTNIQNVNNLVNAAKTFQSNVAITKEDQEKLDGMTNLLSLLEFDGKSPQDGYVYMLNNGSVLVNVKYDDRCYAKDFYETEVVVTDPVNGECEIDMTYNINSEEITINSSGFSSNTIRLLESSDITRLFSDTEMIEELNFLLLGMNTSFSSNGLEVAYSVSNEPDPMMTKKDYKVKPLGLKKEVKATQMVSAAPPSTLLLYFDPTNFDDNFLFSFDINANNTEDELEFSGYFIPVSTFGEEHFDKYIDENEGQINIKQVIKNAHEPYILLMFFASYSEAKRAYINNIKIGTSCLKEKTVYAGSTISKSSYIDDGILDSNANEIKNIPTRNITTNLPDTPAAGKFNYTYNLKIKNGRLNTTKTIIAGLANVLEHDEKSLTINDYPDEYYAVLKQCFDDNDDGTIDRCVYPKLLAQNSNYNRMCYDRSYRFEILDIKTDAVMYSQNITQVGYISNTIWYCDNDDG